MTPRFKRATRRVGVLAAAIPLLTLSFTAPAYAQQITPAGSLDTWNGGQIALAAGGLALLILLGLVGVRSRDNRLRAAIVEVLSLIHI